jgi:FAD/FMN-containing dehydrogenase
MESREQQLEARHRAIVERIAHQLRERRSSRPLSLKKRSVSHQVPKAGDLKYSDDKLDVSDLDAILRIDPDRRICVAEPGVTFVALVAATLRHGLVPTVVPELKTITVGGAVAGCSIESMSFRYGGFHDSCTAYEVITARGEILNCAPDDEDPLLFEMMHGTFGTLGIISKLTFKLVPAQPFVHVTHERYRRLDDFQAAIVGHRARGDLDFMDGFVHSPDEYVLCVGRFTSTAPYVSRYDWLKVYCESTRTRREDFLRTADYFFRYDRGVTNVHPRSWIGRLLFGKLLGSSQLLRLAEIFHDLFSAERPTITLDVFIPFSKVPSFLDWYGREFRFYPLWCVPYQRVRDYAWLSPNFYARCEDTLFLDLAIYGMKQPRDRNYHALMERKLMELGGLKTLISHNYYSEDDFWKIYNLPNYARVKARTDPDNVFRDLFLKTCRAARGLTAATAARSDGDQARARVRGAASPPTSAP